MPNTIQTKDAPKAKEKATRRKDKEKAVDAPMMMRIKETFGSYAPLAQFFVRRFQDHHHKG